MNKNEIIAGLEEEVDSLREQLSSKYDGQQVANMMEQRRAAALHLAVQHAGGNADASTIVSNAAVFNTFLSGTAPEGTSLQ